MPTGYGPGEPMPYGYHYQQHQHLQQQQQHAQYPGPHEYLQIGNKKCYYHDSPPPRHQQHPAAQQGPQGYHHQGYYHGEPPQHGYHQGYQHPGLVPRHPPPHAPHAPHPLGLHDKYYGLVPRTPCTPETIVTCRRSSQGHPASARGRRPSYGPPAADGQGCVSPRAFNPGPGLLPTPPRHLALVARTPYVNRLPAAVGGWNSPAKWQLPFREVEASKAVPMDLDDDDDDYDDEICLPPMHQPPPPCVPPPEQPPPPQPVPPPEQPPPPQSVPPPRPVPPPSYSTSPTTAVTSEKWTTTASGLRVVAQCPELFPRSAAAASATASQEEEKDTR